MRSTRPLSLAASEHEDVTSARHRKDKAKNESFKSREWIVEEVPSTAAKPPGLEAPWRGERAGRSYRLVSGVPLKSTPAANLQLREDLRKKHTTYQGRITRRSRKGVEREAWVSRPFRDPVAGVLITYPPWLLRMLKLAPQHEQDRILDAAALAAVKELQDAGWQPIAIDHHEDTAQAHTTISCLRIDEVSKRLIGMPSQSAWTLCMERLQRFGVEHPDPQKRQWLKDNLARGGITPDVKAYRAADAVLLKWIEGAHGNAESLSKKYLGEFSAWQKDAQNKREGRIAVKLLRAIERRTGQILVSTTLLKVAGMIKEPIAQAKKERDELAKANDAFYRVR